MQLFFFSPARTRLLPTERPVTFRFEEASVVPRRMRFVLSLSGRMQ